MPFSRANLQFVTGLPRKKLEAQLDALVADGVLDVDSDDAGELVWNVPGAPRSTTGPERAEDVRKLADLKREVAGGARKSTALVKATPRAMTLPSGGERKSLVASGLLSFFLGPLGWLYAAPLKEAVVAILVYAVVMMVLPHFLLAPLAGILSALSAAIGVGYAYRHNQKGERASLMPARDSK